jgi:DNA-binding GntR family transcriptional regulator
VWLAETFANYIGSSSFPRNEVSCPARGFDYSSRRTGHIANDHEHIVEALNRRDRPSAEASVKHLVEAKLYWATHFADSYHRPVQWLED